MGRNELNVFKILFCKGMIFLHKCISLLIRIVNSVRCPTLYHKIFCLSRRQSLTGKTLLR